MEGWERLGEKRSDLLLPPTFYTRDRSKFALPTRPLLQARRRGQPPVGMACLGYVHRRSRLEM